MRFMVNAKGTKADCDAAIAAESAKQTSPITSYLSGLRSTLSAFTVPEGDVVTLETSGHVDEGDEHYLHASCVISSAKPE